MRYRRAVDDVLGGGYTKRDARVKLFVKFEKLSNNKVNPDPRAIQYRSARYCVALGRFLKPLEEVLYRLHGDGDFLPATRCIAKGLSQAGRARLLMEKLARFTCPVVLSLDATRFDLHVHSELLKVEHMVYLAMNPDPEFAKLLSWQLHNKGVSDLGIKYDVEGRRMSGDMNTALGNCVLMVLMVATIMSGRMYDLLDDGDDCLLIIESEELKWVTDNVHQQFLEFGMEIKVENIASELEEIEFCQAKPIRINEYETRFVRNPDKVFSTCLGGTKYFCQEGARASLINTIGMAELVLNLGVPVMQEFALALCRNASTEKQFSLDLLETLSHRLKRELAERNMRQLVRLDPAPITHCARVSFEKAFGLTVTEQLDMEKFLSQWSFNMGKEQQLTAEVVVDSWEWLHNSTAELHCPWENDEKQDKPSFHSPRRRHAKA